ncbi:hypothetical protein HZS_3742 [Henneguya salminicola]|nr:hypothetical protein HZS_3742 [Henneguya salminicola]
MDGLAHAYCSYQDNLRDRKEPLFIFSGLILQILVEKIRGLPNIYFPLSLYPKIVKNENIIKSSIVSPLNSRKGIFLGLNFYNKNDSKKHYKYSVIFHNHLVQEKSSYWSTHFIRENALVYLYSFCAVVQDLTEYFMIQIELGIKNVQNIKKYINHSPLFCEDQSRDIFSKVVSIPNSISLSLIPSLVFICKYLINEKENHLVDFFLAIGINAYTYNIFTIFIEMLFTMILYIPVIFLISHMNILTYSHIAILFISVYANLFANFCIFYLISSIFNTSSIGIIFGIIFLLFGTGPGMILRINLYLSKNNIFPFFACLCFQTAFGELLDYFVYVDYFKKISVDLNNVFIMSIPTKKYKIYYYFAMILIDGLLYVMVSVIWIYLKKKGLKRIVKRIVIFFTQIIPFRKKGEEILS